MTLLILGLILFLGVHSIRIVAPDVRARVIARGGGVGAWMWPYTAIAGAGFALLVLGYAQARQGGGQLYHPPSGLRYLALVAMLPVFPLLLATYIRGRIRQALGHPMLIATLLWASAHLMTNGRLPGLLLFGGFGAWAAFALRAAIRREPSAERATVIPWGRNDAIAVIGGLTLFVAFIGGLHAVLFGVPLV